MHADRQQKLIDTLNRLDAAKVRFHDAKQRLLKEGYSEDEIGIAVASASFDGKANEPKKPSELQQIYEANPEEADKIAKQLLLEDAEKRQREARLQALSVGMWSFGTISPMSARSYMALFDALGIPFFRLMFVTVFIVAVLYGVMQTTHLINIDGILVFLWVYGALLSVTASYKLIAMGVRTARLRSSVDGTSGKAAIMRSVMTTVLLLIAMALTTLFSYLALFV